MKKTFLLKVFLLVISLSTYAQANMVAACHFITEDHRSVDISAEDGSNGGIQVGLVSVDSQLLLVTDQIVQSQIQDVQLLNQLIEQNKKYISSQDTAKIAEAQVITLGENEAVVTAFFDQQENVLIKIAKTNAFNGICQ